MPPPHNFEHLPLVLRYKGRAKLPRGGKTDPTTADNKVNRRTHSANLRSSGTSTSSAWKSRIQRNEQAGSPVVPKGMPILLEVDPGLELDILREKFAFEIVAEQEEGFVIVASEDLDLTHTSLKSLSPMTSNCRSALKHQLRENRLALH